MGQHPWEVAQELTADQIGMYLAWWKFKSQEEEKERKRAERTARARSRTR